MSLDTFLGSGVKKEDEVGEVRVRDDGVGGQENELFAHTINLIILKIKRDPQACNWPLN